MRAPFFIAALLLAARTFAAPAAATGPDPVFMHAATVEQVRALLAEPMRRAAGAQTISGQFTQERRIVGMSHPLRSRGEFLCAPSLGVRWHTLAPIESDFVLPSGGARDAPPQLQAALSGAASALQAMLTLDLNALAGQFDFFVAGRPAQWTLGLRPRAEAMKSVLAALVLRGDARVQSVTFDNPQGDRAVLSLRQVRLSSAPPDAAQRAAFRAAGAVR